MTFIIAEIGVNHNGSIGRAMDLVDAAAEAGCDAVKFQAFNPLMAGDNIDYRNILRRYELLDNDLLFLSSYVRQKGLDFLCTPFDEERLHFVDQYLVPSRMKISSQSVTNHRLMAAAIDTGIPLIISNGMCNDTQMHVALTQRGDIKKRTTILYCVSKYPTPDVDIDLREIQRLRKEFDCDVGFSCHSASMWPSIAAAAAGAQVIEKHITISQSDSGPDHKASLEAKDLKSWVQQIRYVEVA